ncbi:condensin complex subunit 3-like [Copidosoma floridanum]|nr:condensin complex subunit 3-like [Copidosoma floridanum]
MDVLKEQLIALDMSEEPEPRDCLPTESQAVSEEKNDPETIIRCLQIMYFMMQSKTIVVLSPTLRTLMESITLPYINLQNTHIKVLSLALECVGLCCHVDKDLAKKYLMMYFLYITESADENVWIAATEVIFDLLLKYGFEHFEITQEGTNNIQDTSKKSKSVRLYSHNDEDTNVNDKNMHADGSHNVIKALIALLDNQVQNLQSVAAEGLCKLILHKKIVSHQLISQLLILWHNPSTKDNPFLSQCICGFFNLYISRIPESQAILEEAYLPTLKMLANAPEMSPLQEIDALRVSEIIIKLTCCHIHNNYSTHNQLTYTILSEILNPETEIELDVLIKSLKCLDVQLDGQNLKNDILKALDDVENLLNASGEKRLLNYINIFRAKVTAPSETLQGDNTANPDNHLEDKENEDDTDRNDEIEQEGNEDEEMEEGD